MDPPPRYRGIRGIPDGNRNPGVQGDSRESCPYILHRDDGQRTAFITLTFWDSIEAVHRFAGQDVERAVFYPADGRFLIDRETTASNYLVVEALESQ